jgi:hypothetical protein
MKEMKFLYSIGKVKKHPDKLMESEKLDECMYNNGKRSNPKCKIQIRTKKPSDKIINYVKEVGRALHPPLSASGSF